MLSLAAAGTGSGKLGSPDTGQEKLGAARRAGRQSAEALPVPTKPTFVFSVKSDTNNGRQLNR